MITNEDLEALEAHVDEGGRIGDVWAVKLFQEVLRLRNEMTVQEIDAEARRLVARDDAYPDYGAGLTFCAAQYRVVKERKEAGILPKHWKHPRMREF